MVVMGTRLGGEWRGRGGAGVTLKAQHGGAFRVMGLLCTLTVVVIFFFFFPGKKSHKSLFIWGVLWFWRGLYLLIHFTK